MHCPFCTHTETTVLDSRIGDEGDVIRRRRQCAAPACGKRFTTYERAEVAMPMVVKKDGVRVEFSREKLRASMQLALRKRSVSAEHIDEALRHIELALASLGAKEIASRQIGEAVMRELKKLDKVAYIRFASVYRSFSDIDEFTQVIQELD